MENQSPLKEKLVRLITAGGPLSLAEYMHICMADPQYGYYKIRDVIGAGQSGGDSGDFITAPEISQMFGELIGIWCIAAWQVMDRPARFSLVELGPGKGTLMNDLLRAARQMPGFLDAANVVMVETSNRLADIQRRTLEPHEDTVNSLQWIGSIEDLPDQPAVFIGNEFLDVLPFRQYVKTPSGWNEVGISLDDKRNLQKGAMATSLETHLLPKGADTEPEGSVFELAPARQAVASELASRIADNGGAALLIDYGHGSSGFGDTFQAIRNHSFANPLKDPGNSDLTSHVDFERLQQAAMSVEGIRAGVTTQGDFLLSLGLLERAGALGAGKNHDTQNELRSQVERLAGPDKMGNLFKVMAIMPRGIHLPAFP